MHAATSSSHNVRKSWTILILFVIFLGTLGFIIGKLFDFGLAGGSIGVAFGAVYGVFMYFHADLTIIRVLRARKISRETNMQLYQKVQDLAAAANLPTPELYALDSTAINCLSVGRTTHSGKIIVTSGLLEHLTQSEIEAVLAHELTHIATLECHAGSIITLIPGIITFWSEYLARKGGILRLLSWIIAIFIPISALLMHSSLSPKREFEADAAAILLTKFPEGLIHALEKTMHDTHPVSSAYAATAHLFFVPPYTTRKQPFLASVMAAHPPRSERIKILQNL